VNESGSGVGEKDFAMGAGVLGLIALVAIVLEIVS
jgi:hypothetical protein